MKIFRSIICKIKLFYGYFINKIPEFDPCQTVAFNILLSNIRHTFQSNRN